MASLTSWIPRPDRPRLEARRRRWLATAEALVEEAGNLGCTVCITGSVLRPARAPFGFHERSDVDLVVVTEPGPTLFDEPLRGSGLPELIERYRTETGIPFSRITFSRPPEPFDPRATLERKRVAIRSDDRYWSLRMVEGMLKLACQGRYGWVPAIPFVRNWRHELLLMAALGIDGQGPLMSRDQVALLEWLGFGEAEGRDAPSVPPISELLSREEHTEETVASIVEALRVLGHQLTKEMER